MRRFAFLSSILLAAFPLTASAQDLSAARTFVTGLYAAYSQRSPDYLGRQARSVFTPELLRLIRLDATVAQGQVGLLDGDPICDCQDPEGLKVDAIAVTATGEAAAQAEVKFNFGAEARTVRLDLKAVGRHWRVDDVRTRETPSLAGLLRAGLTESR